MRLERLEVTGFGRLRQRRFDFGERITVVLGDVYKRQPTCLTAS